MELVVTPLTGATVRVARALLAGGPQTAAALATTLDLTATAIRRHLDTLVRDGHAVAGERAPYGPAARTARRGRGRPAKVFSITPAGRDALDLYTRNGGGYDLMARDALAYLAQAVGPDAVRDFARRRVGEALQAYAASVGGPDQPMAQRVEALAQRMTQDGYAATLTQVGPGGVQLCQHNCPVAHVAEEFPELCQAETDAISELLGVNVTRLATIARGAGVCTTHVPTTLASTTPSAPPQEESR